MQRMIQIIRKPHDTYTVVLFWFQHPCVDYGNNFVCLSVLRGLMTITIDEAVEITQLATYGSATPGQIREVLKYLEAERDAMDEAKRFVNRDGSAMIREQAV